MTVGRALGALLLWGALAHAQGPVLHVVDLGPGAGPRVLERAFAKPYTVVPPGQRQALLPRDSTYQRTVIVLGRDAALDGRVEGDVIVIGGDLHVHPRATVTGQAIAVGGGVYVSAMSTVTGGIRTFPDFTYEIAPVSDGYELRYLSLFGRPASPVTWPGIYGVREPVYDRTDGLAVPFAPLIAVPGAHLLVEPGVTYRSQLGRVDPTVTARLALDRRTTISVNAEQGTFTNEAWIWSDLLNSLATISSGDDNRNYFRATRVDASLSRAWEWSASTLTPYVGARWEQATSARPDSFATGGPWSFSGRREIQDMLRPNPPIDSGTIISALIGAHLEQDVSGIATRARVDVEIGGFNPRFGGSRSFAQLTFDGAITFPTFGTQSLRFEGHAVATASGTFATDHVVVVQPGQIIVVAARVTDTPRQRWAYVGGLGSLPTVNMLSRGGDELIYLDGRYNIPIDRVQLPLVGAPVVTLRSVLAGADVQRWPDLAQAVGVRASASVVYAEYLIDPAHRHSFFGVGLSLTR